MIAIIDYGMGNLRSVQKAFEFLGYEAVITDSPEVIASASHVILPGRVQPSTFGTGELNFCVRYGNRWDLSVITTGRGVFDPF